MNFKKQIALIAVSVFLMVLGFTTIGIAQQTTIDSDSLMNRSNIKGPLEFQGYVKELSKKLKGAIVTLYESPDGSHENLTEIFRTVTPGSGQFDFKLAINKHFVLAVEKGGYTTKKVDFDTDVTLAREQYTSVPKFEFEVDMVKDLDGLAFTGSVASVFYQIKTNKFDYQLDYSKEEMEDEERELRERQERERLARLAFEKKQELEEAAKVLLDKDNSTAQEIIKASIAVGDGNKEKTIKGFLDVFSEADTLRNKKAAIMYDELLEERERVTAGGGDINFQSIFNSAIAYEEKVSKEAEEQRQKKVAILRAEQEEVERASKEAMAIQQKAIEVKAQEKLAAAVEAEELRRQKEDQEKRDNVYYAIFNADGNSETAIQNLVKTFPKSDPYKETKARAIYDEYEKTRLTGTTLSKMDFGKLFDAADTAEQIAIAADLEKDNAKQNSKLDAFMKKVEEKKQEEQKEAVDKIEKGLKTASADRASQVEVFQNALPKNDPYKEVKAAAMYDHYVEQKKAVEAIEKQLKTAGKDRDSQLAVFYNALPENTPDREQAAERMYESYVASKQAQGGTGVVSMDFGSLFQVADNAAKGAQQEAKEKNIEEKQQAQELLESKREEIRQQKADLAARSEREAQQVQRAQMSDAKSKKEKDLAAAIEKGAGDRDNTVLGIMKVLPETGDKELDRNRAEALYDKYLQESNSIKTSNTVGQKINFDVLFAAADQAELALLEKQFEAKQAKEEVKLAEYEERRTEKAIEIAQAQKKEAEKEAERAEIAYEEALHKTETARQERLAEVKKQQEELAKQRAMETAKREQLELERKEGELALLEKERRDRLSKEAREAELLAAAEAEKARRQKEKEEKELQEQLAQLEKQKKAAEEAERKRIEEEQAEEARLALAAQKEAEAKERAEAKRAEELDKQRIADELAAAKLAQEERKAEEKRLQEEEDERKRQALAAKKEAEEQERAEAKRLEDLEKQRVADLLAAEKAAEEARKLEEKKQQELAQQQTEEAERIRQENYNQLIFKGDQAVAKNDFATGWKNYQDALALYPDNKDAAKKLKDAEVEKIRVEEEQAAQLALDDRFNKLMTEGEESLAENNYDAAKIKFEKASELKPDESEPKQQIRNIDRTLAQLAQEEKERQAAERKFVLLMQEGSKAITANQLDVAKEKFNEASSLKPEDSSPLAKLEEIKELEDQIAANKAKELERQEEAKRQFEKEQEIKRQQEADLAAKKEAERAARIAALTNVDEIASTANLTEAEKEKARIDKYEKLKESLGQLDLNAEEQRRAFLSELAKIYPPGLTVEEVNGKNFVMQRHVINVDNVVTVYEKKTWDWGGVFYFKDSDIAITEAIYKLEIGKY